MAVKRKASCLGAIIRSHEEIEKETGNDLTSGNGVSSTCASVEEDDGSDNRNIEDETVGETDDDEGSDHSSNQDVDHDWNAWTCPECGMVLTSKKSQWEHSKTHGGTKSTTKNPCPDCSRSFETRNSLRLHMNIKHECPSLGNVTCLECGKSFEKKSQLKMHMKSHSSTGTREDSSATGDAGTESSMMMECLMCFKKFANAIELGNHYVLQHGNHNGQLRYQCPFCPEKTYATQGSLKEHILVHHLDKKLHSCSICRKEFIRRDNMIKHLKSIHKVNHTNSSDSDNLQEEEQAKSCDKKLTPFAPQKKCCHNEPSLQLKKRTPKLCSVCGWSCLECSYVFTTKKNFSAHTHDNFCIQCRLKFLNGKMYRLHIKYHESKTFPRCEDCRLGFDNGKKLQTHMRIWHGVDPLFCPICGKTFKAKINLRIHQEIHKERQHICEICLKAFQTNAHLKRHLANHPPLLPIKVEDGVVVKKEEKYRDGDHGDEEKGEAICEKCSKVCPSAAKLKIHMRVHSHVCTVCYKSFTRPRDLRLHQHCHKSSGKPYRCEKCSNSYLKQQGLTLHMMSEHGFKPKYMCKPCRLPFSSEKAMESHFANKSCEKRKISRKKELNRRVEATRQKRRKEYGLLDENENHKEENEGSGESE